MMNPRPSPTFTTQEGLGWFVIVCLSLFLFLVLLDNCFDFLRAELLTFFQISRQCNATFLVLFSLRKMATAWPARTVGKFSWNYGQQSVRNFRQMRTRLCSKEREQERPGKRRTGRQRRHRARLPLLQEKIRHNRAVFRPSGERCSVRDNKCWTGKT